MIRYGQHVQNTPQSEPLTGQVENSAGGFAFPVDQWTALERFLILGSEGGSYYAGEAKLTRDNAKSVVACIKADGARAVQVIASISHDGRAPKNDPAIFALALTVKEGDTATRRLALAELPRVARIGTHIFQFVQHLKDLGVGWGRAVKRGIAQWYLNQAPGKLVTNAIKYQSRDGWSHRDLLRLGHPRAGDVSVEEAQRAAILNWIAKGWPDVGEQPHPDVVLARVWAFERAKKLEHVSDAPELCKLISTYGLPRECVPSWSLNIPGVWSMLLSSMGATAMLRNLGKMTAVGLLAPMSPAVAEVREKLCSFEELRAARVHPLAVLLALKTYAQGHGEKGKLSWSPNQKIVDVLDEAFYLAFKAVEPTGKRTLLAIDASGSMDQGQIAGMTGISPRIGAAAMALVTVAVEPNVETVAFTAGPHRSRFAAGCGLVPFAMGARSRLDDVVTKMREVPFGGTDCALPMLYALEKKMPVDTFVIYTDSETWAGDIHPVQALREYRRATGIPAKLVVVGMVANGFSIADPNDAGMLDVVGFDTAAPAVIADFSR